MVSLGSGSGELILWNVVEQVFLFKKIPLDQTDAFESLVGKILDSGRERLKGKNFFSNFFFTTAGLLINYNGVWRKV